MEEVRWLDEGSKTVRWRKCAIKGNTNAVFFKKCQCSLTHVKRAPAVGIVCSCDKHNTLPTALTW